MTFLQIIKIRTLHLLFEIAKYFKIFLFNNLIYFLYLEYQERFSFCHHDFVLDYF